MLAGDTRIDDYTNVVRPTLAEMFEKQEWRRWPIMGWDVDGTYWLRSTWGGPVARSECEFQVANVVLTSSVRELADNGRFSCDWGHMLMCSDGKFRSLKDVVAGDLSLQHGRGVGHNVMVKSVVERKERERLYSFSVPELGCFCHSYAIHGAA